MRVFLLDLWLDLREKRLAPLAILLLAGIVAVPIVLAKGQAEVKAPPQPTTTTAAAASPVIQSQVQEGTVASKLQTFSARDPFEPTSRVVASTGGTTSTAGGGTTSGTGTATGTGTGTGTDTGTGTAGGGGVPTGNGPSTAPGTGTTGNTTGETKTTLFTYTTDLRFGTGGNVEAYKGVKRLDLVPSADDPKIVFLGVTTTGKTAVFLVDQNLGVDTEGGRCRPSADQCTFLYLRPDADHDKALLTDADGTVYHLRLLAIHRVSVSSSNGSTTNGSNGNSGNTNSNRSPAFTGRAGSNDSATDPGQGDTPPGEPDKKSSFQQFFADGGE